MGNGLLRILQLEERDTNPFVQQLRKEAKEIATTVSYIGQRVYTDGCTIKESLQDLEALMGYYLFHYSLPIDNLKDKLHAALQMLSDYQQTKIENVVEIATNTTLFSKIYDVIVAPIERLEELRMGRAAIRYVRKQFKDEFGVVRVKVGKLDTMFQIFDGNRLAAIVNGSTITLYGNTLWKIIHPLYERGYTFPPRL